MAKQRPQLRLRDIVGLVWAFGPTFEKTLIQRLPALESSLYRMPVVNLCFPELPTKENDLIPNLAGEIQQSLIKILNLNTNRVDFLDGILSLLNRGPLGHALTRHSSDINKHAPRKEDVLAEHLQLGFDQAGTRLALNRPPEQGFENGQ